MVHARALSFAALVAGTWGQIRTINGSGNSLAAPLLNAVGSPFQGVRTWYADGVGSIDATLPNARVVSNSLFSTGPFVMNTFSVAATLVAFGQFIAHDIVLTTPQPNAATTNDVVSVAVPATDTGLDPVTADAGGSGLHAPLTITRTVYNATTGTSIGNPRRQLNMATGWIDASTVYGHTDARAREVRAFTGGLLLADPINGVPMNSEGPGGACLTMAHPGLGPCGLRLAGDVRANVAPGILAIHGVFVLSHNWWARRLALATPGLDDETLYQEARKRVMAEVQAITFQEYAPVILGAPLPAYPGYNASLDPGVSPAFAIAAYRYGHSGINSIYLCLEADGTECSIGHLVLRDVYFRPAYLNFTSIVQILRGMAAHPESGIDTRMVPDVRNALEGMRNDLAVMDIMRGRDFGLPSFSQARADLGLQRPVTFSDITSDATVAAALSSLYGGNISAVELWVGGLAESATSNAFLGPTFAAIIRDQFIRLRDGDRLFYNNPLLTSPDGTGRYLPLDDLRTVTQSRLSTIIARVTGWTDPPMSMFTVSTPAAMRAGAAPPAAIVPVGPPAAAAAANNRRAQLSPFLTVDWVPPSPGDTTITLMVTLASGAGWAGLGLGEAMSPPYAAGDGAGPPIDMWLFTYTPGGAGQVVDASSVARVVPVRDALQDVVLVTSSRNATTTSWTVRRALTTGDNSDRAIVSGAMRIVYAWSTTSPVVAYHTAANRGAATLDFIPAAVGAGPAAASVTSPSASVAAGIAVGVIGCTVSMCALAAALVLWRRTRYVRTLATWQTSRESSASVDIVDVKTGSDAAGEGAKRTVFNPVRTAALPTDGAYRL